MIYRITNGLRSGPYHFPAWIDIVIAPRTGHIMFKYNKINQNVDTLQEQEYSIGMFLGLSLG